MRVTAWLWEATRDGIRESPPRGLPQEIALWEAGIAADAVATSWRGP
jgi:hypothetical protein